MKIEKYINKLKKYIYNKKYQIILASIGSFIDNINFIYSLFFTKFVL